MSTVGDIPVSCKPASAGTDATVFTKPAEAGQVLQDGDLLAAVNGRPVLVLRGGTDAFRTLLPGVTGIDVEQLQAGLKRLGHRITDKKGVMGPSTQQAVARWYADRGFAATEPTAEQSAALRAAADAVSQAEADVESAKRVLRDVRAGPSRSELLASQLAIDQAKAQVREAVTDQERALAVRQLEIAEARDKELRKSPDLSAAKAAVTRGETAHKRAKEDLATLTSTTGVSVPYCEVIFLPRLPVTVTPTDNSSAAEGTMPSVDAWVTLAPGELLLRGALTGSDGALVVEGASVSFRADGATEDRHGTVTAVHAANGQVAVEITPDEPFGQDEQGANLRVSITVGSTSGEVLVVPLAAVSGTASGLARVQKLTAQGSTEIEVRAGLSADGYVEVVPVQTGALAVGDEIVVGQ